MFDPGNPVLVLHQTPDPNVEGVVGRFSCIEEAEDFIATLLMWADPCGVENGHYRIDGPWRMEEKYAAKGRNETWYKKGE